MTSAPKKYSQQVQLLKQTDNEADTSTPQSNIPYTIKRPDGTVLTRGQTDDEGKTTRVYTDEAEELHVYIGEGKWSVTFDLVRKSPPSSNNGETE